MVRSLIGHDEGPQSAREGHEVTLLKDGDEDVTRMTTLRMIRCKRGMNDSRCRDGVARLRKLLM